MIAFADYVRAWSDDARLCSHYHEMTWHDAMMSAKCAWSHNAIAPCDDSSHTIAHGCDINWDMIQCRMSHLHNAIMHKHNAVMTVTHANTFAERRLIAHPGQDLAQVPMTFFTMQSCANIMRSCFTHVRTQCNHVHCCLHHHIVIAWLLCIDKSQQHLAKYVIMSSQCDHECIKQHNQIVHLTPSHCVNSSCETTWFSLNTLLYYWCKYKHAISWTQLKHNTTQTQYCNCANTQIHEHNSNTCHATTLQMYDFMIITQTQHNIANLV
jgi:hypothetical protein